MVEDCSKLLNYGNSLIGSLFPEVKLTPYRLRDRKYNGEEREEEKEI